MRGLKRGIVVRRPARPGPAMALAVMAVVAVAALMPVVWAPGALAAGEAAEEDSPSSGLFVTGEGEVMIQADIAYVSLGVENFARTTTEAQRDNARATTAVIQRLVGAGVPADRIKSAGFGLYASSSFDKNKGTERIDGYRVTNRLSVTVTDLSRVGAVVDAAIAAGATHIYEVRFTAQDTSQVKADALRRAVAEARAKAEVIAESLGLKLGRVVSAVDEVSAFGPPLLMRMKGAADAAPTPFLPGDVKVTARVTVQFALDR